MSNISFSESGWEDYLYWQTHDKQMLKKSIGYCRIL